MKNKTFERKFDLSCDEELVSHLIYMPRQSHSIRTQAGGWKVKFECKCRWISFTKNLQIIYEFLRIIVFVFFVCRIKHRFQCPWSHEYICYKWIRLIGDYWGKNDFYFWEKISARCFSCWIRWNWARRRGDKNNKNLCSTCHPLSNKLYFRLDSWIQREILCVFAEAVTSRAYFIAFSQTKETAAKEASIQRAQQVHNRLQMSTMGGQIIISVQINANCQQNK